MFNKIIDIYYESFIWINALDEEYAPLKKEVTGWRY